MDGETKPQKLKLNLEATLAAVLAHPTRVRCFVALTERTASATQLMRAWGLSHVGLVKHHIDVLEALGIVEEVDRRPVRGSVEKFYRARVRPIAHDKASEEMTYEERDGLSKYVLQLVTTDAALAVDQGTFDSRTNRAIVRIPMQVDEEGFAEMAAEENATFARRLEIEARSAERMAERTRHDEDPGAIPIRSITMFFEAPDGGGALSVPPKP